LGRLLNATQGQSEGGCSGPEFSRLGFGLFFNLARPEQKTLANLLRRNTDEAL
jgi:hypothetical protein